MSYRSVFLCAASLVFIGVTTPALVQATGDADVRADVGWAGATNTNISALGVYGGAEGALHSHELAVSLRVPPT